MQPEVRLENNVYLQQVEIAQVFKGLGFPVEKCLIVGSAGLYLQKAIRRQPTDIDIYTTDPEVWEAALKLGNIVEFTGDQQQIIRITLDKWDIEVFRTLPGFPKFLSKNLFDRAGKVHGVQCMSMPDIWLWKSLLTLRRDREKKKQDISDVSFGIKFKIKSVFSGTFKRLMSTQNDLEHGLTPEQEFRQNLQHQLENACLDGEIWKLDEQGLEEAETIRKNIADYENVFISAILETLNPELDSTQPTETVVHPIDNWKALTNLPLFGKYKNTDFGLREECLAIFRRQLFDVATQLELGLSREQLFVLQQAVLTFDVELAQLFAQSKLGKRAERLNDQTQDLLSNTEATFLEIFNEYLKTDGLAELTSFVGTHIIDSRAAVNQGILFIIQKQRLRKIFKLPSDPLEATSAVESSLQVAQRTAMSDTAVNHEETVTQILLQFTKEYPLAALIACVHDYFKHSLSQEGQGRVELGLHEVGSALQGSKVLEIVAKYITEQKSFINFLAKYQEKTGVSLPQIAEIQKTIISGIQKLAFKTISVHGEREFPFARSSKNPLYSQELLQTHGATKSTDGIWSVKNEKMHELRIDSSLRRLFGSHYPVCKSSDEIALCQNPEQDKFFRKIVQMISVVDELVGAFPASFVKYNQETPNTAFSDPEVTEFKNYIDKYTLASVVNCFEEKTLAELGWGEQAQIQDLKWRAALLSLFAETFKRDKHDFQIHQYEQAFPEATEYFMDLFSAMRDVVTIFRLLQFYLNDLNNPDRINTTRKQFNTLFTKVIQEIENFKLADAVQAEPKLKEALNQTWEQLVKGSQERDAQ